MARTIPATKSIKEMAMLGKEVVEALEECKRSPRCTVGKSLDWTKN